MAAAGAGAGVITAGATPQASQAGAGTLQVVQVGAGTTTEPWQPVQPVVITGVEKPVQPWHEVLPLQPWQELLLSRRPRKPLLRRPRKPEPLPQQLLLPLQPWHEAVTLPLQPVQEAATTVPVQPVHEVATTVPVQLVPLQPLLFQPNEAVSPDPAIAIIRTIVYIAVSASGIHRSRVTPCNPQSKNSPTARSRPPRYAVVRISLVVSGKTGCPGNSLQWGKLA